MIKSVNKRARKGNFTLVAKNPREKEVLKTAGKTLIKNLFAKNGIDGKPVIRPIKGKDGHFRITFQVDKSQKEKVVGYDTCDAGNSLFIWSFTFALFGEKLPELIETWSNTKPSTFIDKEGLLSILIHTENEGGEGFLMKKLEESGFKVRKKNRAKNGDNKPGCVVTIETGYKTTNPVKQEPIGIVGSTISKPRTIPKGTSEKVSSKMLEAFEKTVLIYLDGLPKKKQLELGLKLIEGQNIGLYLNDDSVTHIKGTEQVIVTPITKG